MNKSDSAYPPDNPVRFQHGKFPFESKLNRGTTKGGKVKADFDNLYKAGNAVNDLVYEMSEAAWHKKKLEEVEEVIRTKTYSTKMRDVKVEYWWGVSGAGKTHGVISLHGIENVYTVSNYSHPFYNYTGQKVILFDEFRSSINQLSYFLNLIDKYPVQLDARYKNKWAAYDRFISSVTNLLNPSIHLSKKTILKLGRLSDAESTK